MALRGLANKQSTETMLKLTVDSGKNKNTANAMNKGKLSTLDLFTQIYFILINLFPITIKAEYVFKLKVSI